VYFILTVLFLKCLLRNLSKVPAQDRSQWPRGLRLRYTAARPLRLRGSNPTGGMDVCCECCVLSVTGLCDGLITPPEESYRLWRVVVFDQETSRMRRLKPATGPWKTQPQGCNAKKTNNQTNKQTNIPAQDGSDGLLIRVQTNFSAITINKVTVSHSVAV